MYVHQSRKPRHGPGNHHRQRRVTGSGKAVSVHCGQQTAREAYWRSRSQGAPPVKLYHGDNIKTFGELGSKNHTILKKILALPP
jgi:hypothetical protein